MDIDEKIEKNASYRQAVAKLFVSYLLIWVVVDESPVLTLVFLNKNLSGSLGKWEEESLWYVLR